MSSSVPAAVGHLLTAFTAAVDSGTIVHFGPPMVNADAREHVAVAYAPEGGDAIDTSSEWAALGAQRHEERYEVVCPLTVWAGESSEDSMLTAFLRTYTVFAQLCAAIAADYTLGQAVREARVASHSTALNQTDAGNAVTLTFRVACAARITY